MKLKLQLLLGLMQQAHPKVQVPNNKIKRNTVLIKKRFFHSNLNVTVIIYIAYFRKRVIVSALVIAAF